MSIPIVALIVLSALHLVVTLALVIRVRELQAMVVGDGALAALPAAGTPIGAFEVTTPKGEVLNEALLQDDTVLVGFFSPNCEWCEKARVSLLAEPPKVPVLAFIRGDDGDDEARTLRASLEQIARVAYTKQGDNAYRAFAPTGFPSLYLVKNGLVASASHQLSDVAA